MVKVRRTIYLFFYGDFKFLDLEQLFEGNIKIRSYKQLSAISILKNEVYPITIEELKSILNIPSNTWISIDEIPMESSILYDFARKGFILIDDENEELKELIKRDEMLSTNAWDIYSALYHFMTKWENIITVGRRIPPDIHYNMKKVAEAMDNSQIYIEALEKYGKPPEAFYEIKQPMDIFELPLIEKNNEFYKILLRRKTTRNFDLTKTMRLEDLATVLYYVYGSHGYLNLFNDTLTSIKKTSPSGGGLHPIETYLLIINVDQLNPGIYHYNVKNHSLELMEKMSNEEARELADEFTAGQIFPSWAHVLFIMTSRFYRNYWKYRHNNRTYRVLYMDVAHLSQTFYLVCTELGIGAFVTAAINSINIEKRLGIDDLSEGVLAICGCGIPSKDQSLAAEFLPYSPRKTQIRT